MKQEPFDQEFNRIFKWLGNDSSPSQLKFELDLYKKLWNFFLIGDSYYFIINHHTLQFEFVSNEVETVMGYLPSEFDIPFMNDKLHPDDRSWFLAIGACIVDFFSQLPVDKITKYKVRYDIRFKKRNGEFARILYQGILLEHDASGKFLRTLSVHSDITYLKLEGHPVLSFIGIDGEPSYLDVISNNKFVESKEEFTKREKQVLKLLIEGRPSKEISGLLKISKQTVDTHRKNMLHKKHLNNTGELIGKAIRSGWI
ncbi:LuxR C-terminal-related transcriptional regulator [Lacibacter sp. H375]|uniref:LuxR C-terminal-related transcriptional regulator n=1 Tax=Lacibacter sp. H375 TaxID=3133424 RepID=UPI0030C5D093